MPKLRLKPKALKKSLWSSLARVIGVALGSTAGIILHEFMGDELQEQSTIAAMFVISFLLIWFAEYERESY